MAIPKETVIKMTDLLKKGYTTSNPARKYSKYSYWEIYWTVDDYSILGKKRSISYRLKKLENDRMPRNERAKLVKEIKENLNGIYSITKKNGKKLIDIGKIMEK